MKFSIAYLDDAGDLHLQKTASDGSGFRLHVTSYWVRLYRWPVCPLEPERYEGKFNTIVDALEEAKGWT